MIKEKSLYVGLVGLLVNSCRSFPPPKSELCLSGDNYTFICHDDRQDPKDYEKEYPLDYVCTNPKDFSRMYDYCVDIREKLIKCRSGY